MASLSMDERGRATVQFVRVIGTNPDGTLRRQRKTIRLGDLSRSSAKRFCDYVGRLVACSAGGAMSLEGDITAFLEDLDDRYYGKLAKVGLVPRRQSSKPDPFHTLERFTADYITLRQDVKPETRRGLGNTQEELISYFGAERDIRAITEGDAQEWYQWMVSDSRELRSGIKGKIAANTARRRAGRAKQFFAHAMRKGLITQNPFVGVKCRVGGSPDRLKFIPQEVVNQVLEQIQDAEFRAAVVLGRWGGLRIPSELVRMQWGDVDFDKKRLLIRVPKLEHIQGKETRLIPLFPEIDKALAALYVEDFGPQEKVFQRIFDPTKNLRTQFARYIIRSGIEPWPKLWQNLRASRATEIAENYPQHVATAWMGHTAAIAEAHYWQTRERYFDQATDTQGQPAKCDCGMEFPQGAKFCPGCGRPAGSAKAKPNSAA